jgi:hypothetical protein
VTGLLGDPGAIRAGGHAGHMHEPCADLHDEEDEQPAQCDRVDGEEVTRQPARSMCTNEAAPPIAGSAGCRPPAPFVSGCGGSSSRSPGVRAASDLAGPRAFLDRVVSSYTPAIRALAHARAGPGPAPGGTAPAVGHAALIVALPDTPNAPALPGVRAEVDLLRSLLPDADVLAGPGATRDTVLTALPGLPVAHFACHGSSDWADPDASHLLLHDHDTHPLTISEISRLDLASAGLAYLSACSTTDGVPRLADEAVRITAAFQLAGYRHVIGTLCP